MELFFIKFYLFFINYLFLLFFTVKVNDEIEIVGKISKLGNKTVYLEDAVI